MVRDLAPSITVFILAASQFIGCSGGSGFTDAGPSDAADAGPSDAAVTNGGDTGWSSDAGFDAGYIEGVLDWVKQYGGDGIEMEGLYDAINAEKGSIYVSGDYADYQDSAYAGSQLTRVLFLRKVLSDGTLSWENKIFSSPDDNNFSGSVLVGKKGAVIQVGRFSVELDGMKAIGTSDVFIRKVNGDGTGVWKTSIGSIDSYAEANGAAGTPDDGVVVVGDANNGLGGLKKIGYYDGFVMKTGVEGAVEWIRLFGVQNKYVTVNAASVDTEGNIFVTGQTRGPLFDQPLTGFSNVFVIKYSSSGDMVWAKLYGADFGEVEGTGIALAGDGSIFVTGTTNVSLMKENVIGKKDIFLMKLDGTGKAIWVKQVGASGKETVASKILLLEGGELLLAGDMEGTIAGKTPIGKRDGFAARFSVEGEIRWLLNIGAENVEVAALGLALDGEGGIFMSASTFGTYDPKQPSSGMDGLLAKISEKKY